MHLHGLAHTKMETIVQVRVIGSRSSFRPQDRTRKASQAFGADNREGAEVKMAKECWAQKTGRNLSLVTLPL